MEREQDRLERIITEMGRGKDLGDELGWNPRTKSFTSLYGADPDSVMEATPQDLTFASGGRT